MSSPPSSSTSAPFPFPSTPSRRSRPFSPCTDSHPLHFSPSSPPSSSDITPGRDFSPTSPTSPFLQTPRTPPTLAAAVDLGLGQGLTHDPRPRKESYGFGSYPLPASQVIDPATGVDPVIAESAAASSAFAQHDTTMPAERTSPRSSLTDLTLRLLMPPLNLDLNPPSSSSVVQEGGPDSFSISPTSISPSPPPTTALYTLPSPPALQDDLTPNLTSGAGFNLPASQDTAYTPSLDDGRTDSRRRGLRESLRKYFPRTISARAGQGRAQSLGYPGDTRGKLKAVFTTRRSLSVPGSHLATPAETSSGLQRTHSAIRRDLLETPFDLGSAESSPALSRRFSVITQPSSTFQEFEQQFSFEVQQQLWNDTDAVIVETHKSKGKQRAKAGAGFNELPREVKILVLRRLMDTHREEDGFGKWQGERGGRRELVRLSSVSREWQALCFDGQLWPVIDLTNLASEIPRETVLRILRHARGFIRSLTLRNMNMIPGEAVIDTLTPDDADEDVDDASNPSSKNQPRSILWPFRADQSLRLPNLTQLDLRGCVLINTRSIVRLIAAAPNLVTVNLRGVQPVDSSVIAVLAATRAKIQDLSLPNFTTGLMTRSLSVYLEDISDDQAAAMRHFRVPRMNLTIRDRVLELIAKRFTNLVTLDIRRWGEVTDSDLDKLFTTAQTSPIRLSLQHLAMSDTRNRDKLTHLPFLKLPSAFPNLRTLELAGMSGVFQGATGAAALCEVVKPLKKLERLDLEGTGASGAVDDTVVTEIRRNAAAREGAKDRFGEAGNPPPPRLVELRIGHAKSVTSEVVVKLIRACPSLRILDLDQTMMTPHVVSVFYKAHQLHTDASLSVLDCKHIPHLTKSTEARVRPVPEAGKGVNKRLWIPFGYTTEELRSRDDADSTATSSAGVATDTVLNVPSRATASDSTIQGQVAANLGSNLNSGSNPNPSSSSSSNSNPSPDPTTQRDHLVIRHFEKWTTDSPPRPYRDALRVFDDAQARGEGVDEALKKVLWRQGGKRGVGVEMEGGGCYIM